MPRSLSRHSGSFIALQDLEHRSPGYVEITVVPAFLSLQLLQLLNINILAYSHCLLPSFALSDATSPGRSCLCLLY